MRTTKHCNGCDQTLGIDRFAIKSSKKGRESKCKTCRGKRRDYASRDKRRKERNRRQIIDYKDNKCANPECPVRHLDLPFCVFEFHHRNPDEKEFNINIASNRGISWARVQRELDKCDMYCCLCHRMLHWESRG